MRRGGRGLGGAGARLAGIGALLLLIAGTCIALAGQAGARPRATDYETRVIELTFKGHVSAGYDSSIKRDAYNCAVSEKGEAKVYWDDAWALTFHVYPRTGHVQFESAKQEKGPVDSENPGSGEASGTRSDVPGATLKYCTSSKHAGSFKCTTEKMKPEEQLEPTVDGQFKGFEITATPFGHTSATYGGHAPENWPCGKDIGSNSVPGGGASPWLGGASAELDFTVKDGEIEHLALHAHYELRMKTDSNAWAGDFPAVGDACSPASDTANAKCTMAEPLEREATATVERIK